jgi:Tol biopolymer transport system component
MTEMSDMEMRLRDGFRSLADTSVPDGQLLRVIAATSAVPQRASWVASVRTSTLGTGDRLLALFTGRRAASLLTAALLVALLVVAAIVGSQRPPNPFGHGLLAFSRDGDIFLAAPDGSDPVLVVQGDGLSLTGPLWSPTGTRVAFRDYAGPVYVLDAATMAVEQFGTGETLVWSPDGASLAVFDRGVLRIVDVATGGARTLTGSEDEPAPTPASWSPDGRWIAASRDGSVIKIDAATGKTEEIVPGAAPGALAHPSWSPDSSRIVFATSDCQGDTGMCTHGVGIVAADGTGMKQIADTGDINASPSWSPHSAWIAYRSPPADELTSEDGLGGMGVAALSVARPDGADSRLIAERVDRWSWSPDGATLLYTTVSAFQEHTNPVMELNVATGETRAVGISADGFAWQPAKPGDPAPEVPATPQTTSEPSAPGQVVAPPGAPPADPTGSFTGIGFDTECQVVMYRFESGEVEPIADVPRCPAMSQSSSSWSPDGSAYLVSMDGGVTVIERDGTILWDREGTKKSTGYGWSPGGRYIVESDCSSGSCRHTILTRDGQERTEISGFAWWSPDDSVLAVTQADGQVLVGAGDGSGLTAIGNASLPISWSPDGSRFAFARDGNAWVMDRDGGNERQISSFALGGATDVSWSPDGHRVAVSRGTALWLLPPDGGAAQRAALPESYRYVQPIWSPDGRRLAVEAGVTADGYYPNGSLPMFIVGVDDGSVVSLEGAGSPVWSPDSRFIALMNTRLMAERQTIEIANADGSGRHELWSGEFGAGQTKAWLP